MVATAPTSRIGVERAEEGHAWLGWRSSGVWIRADWIYRLLDAWFASAVGATANVGLWMGLGGPSASKPVPLLGPSSSSAAGVQTLRIDGVKQMCWIRAVET